MPEKQVDSGSELPEAEVQQALAGLQKLEEVRVDKAEITELREGLQELLRMVDE